MVAHGDITPLIGVPIILHDLLVTDKTVRLMNRPEKMILSDGGYSGQSMPLVDPVMGVSTDFSSNEAAWKGDGDTLLPCTKRPCGLQPILLN